MKLSIQSHWSGSSREDDAKLQFYCLYWHLQANFNFWGWSEFQTEPAHAAWCAGERNPDRHEKGHGSAWSSWVRLEEATSSVSSSLSSSVKWRTRGTWGPRSPLVWTCCWLWITASVWKKLRAGSWAKEGAISDPGWGVMGWRGHRAGGPMSDPEWRTRGEGRAAQTSVALVCLVSTGLFSFWEAIPSLLFLTDLGRLTWTALFLPRAPWSRHGRYYYSVPGFLLEFWERWLICSTELWQQKAQAAAEGHCRVKPMWNPDSQEGRGKSRGVGVRETETYWRDEWGSQSLPFPRLPQLLGSWVSISDFFPFTAPRGATQALPGKPTHLGVVPVPPHVSEGAHLAGPQHGSCVDLFVLRGDKGKRQVHMLQGTWGKRGERRHGEGRALSALHSLLWIHIPSGSLQNISHVPRRKCSGATPTLGERDMLGTIVSPSFPFIDLSSRSKSWVISV